MRGRTVAGAVGLGCAGLTVLAMLTLVAPEAAEATSPGGQCGPRSRSDCQMPTGGMASTCEDAMMNTRPGGSGGVKLTADVADGATVAPGQDITIRLSWDPKAWSGDRLDMALSCVQVKGALDPDLSAEERPTANDGVFEYRLHVPDNIRPNCDICVQGFLAGPAADGGSEQVASNEQCFMSGPPGPPTKPAPPSNPPPSKPPATPPPAPPTTPPPAPPTTPPPAPPTTPPTPAVPPRAPAEVPAEVAGSNVARPATPTPVAPAPAVAPVAELPRTGASVTQVGTAGGGLTLALGGLAVIGGAGRRTRRRPGA